ncbi:MAG: hypothetical protein F7B20_05485 [Aeropyrum sp.]|nr:hypothetical protein [Aeropyrum sp.]
MAIEREAERLLRAAQALRSEEDARVLEELVSCARETIIDAYKSVDMADPLEPLLVGMILCLARKPSRREEDARGL